MSHFEGAIPTVVLILSTGRTGTKFLAHFLGTEFPQVEAHHTTSFSRVFNILGNMHISNTFPSHCIVALWRFLKEREIERCEKLFFVDSNPHLFGIAPLASKLYPNLKFIHIVRDPRTYVRSHLNWARHRPQSFIANYIVPFWQPNPVLVGEVSLREWFSLSKFESYCWVWSYKNRKLSLLEQAEAPYLCILFEDIFSGNDITINPILHFIGLPEVADRVTNHKEPMNVTSKRSFPAWQDWNPEYCARLEELCGPIMRRFGYGRESQWREKVRIGQQSNCSSGKRGESG